MTRHVAVVGAGLTGCLVAARLADAGHRVDLYERRADPRSGAPGEGRSINLALSTRGRDALARLGVEGLVRARAVEVRGRMMHDLDGRLTFQPYGTEADQVLWSVDRDGLNLTVLEAVAARPVGLHFGRRLVDVDLDDLTTTFERPDGSAEALRPDTVIGADGAYSAVRSRLQRTSRFEYEQDHLEHGYKELTIPPAADGSWRLDPHALHIWPRGHHMMIALANPGGSFTCTLFWPYDGPVGFEAITNSEQVLDAFATHFPDLIELCPHLTDDYLANPTGSLVTIRCAPWHLDDRILLLGDAAHAVVPFYGQGANAALEDVTILLDRLEADPTWGHAFEAFFAERKPDTDALADLALDNFIEMRDHVASRRFLAQKAIERRLHTWFPRRFVPLYTLVTFTRTPYAQAVRRAHRQQRTLALATIAVVVVLVGLVVATLVGWLA